MKKARLFAQAHATTELSPEVSDSDAKEGRPAVAADLSPERVTEGSSITTAVLSQILTQSEEFHQLRDWGINE